MDVGAWFLAEGLEMTNNFDPLGVVAVLFNRPSGSPYVNTAETALTITRPARYYRRTPEAQTRTRTGAMEPVVQPGPRSSTMSFLAA